MVEFQRCGIAELWAAASDSCRDSAETWLNQCFHTAGLKFVRQVTFWNIFLSHFLFYFDTHDSLSDSTGYSFLLHVQKSPNEQLVCMNCLKN